MAYGLWPWRSPLATMSSWLATRSIWAIIRAIDLGLALPVRHLVGVGEQQALERRHAGRTQAGDDRRIGGRGQEVGLGHRRHVAVDARRDLGHGEALRERHLGVRLLGRRAQPAEDVAHVVARGQLVVAGCDLQAAVALDVPPEHAGVDDQLLGRQALAQASAGCRPDRR